MHPAAAAVVAKGSLINNLTIDWPKTLCLDEKLPICKVQEILKPECTTVHEDFRILRQRRRWVSFRSSANYMALRPIFIPMDSAHLIN